MTEQRHDTLNLAIDQVASRGEFTSTGDGDLDSLARLAVGLRGLANPDFKARLRAELLPDSKAAGLVARIGELPVVSWFSGQRGLAATGGGCGLMAGACCLGGAVVKVLGLASTVAISAFIRDAIPFTVAVSIVMMAAMVFLLVRQQGWSRGTFGPAAIRVGVVVGSTYGVMFAATMALSMAMGIY